MDKPKLLKHSAAIEQRLAQLQESHIVPLTEYVERLRRKKGAHASIPYFDPWDGGINAEILLLLEAPGAKAKNSGFVSMNNPDETAKNIFEISKEAGLDRQTMIIWNAVPWYIGSDKKIRPATTSDINESILSLKQLLDYLPQLKAIILAGKKPQKVAKNLEAIAPKLRIFHSPHPSPMFVNRHPDNRTKLLQVWQEANVYINAQ